MADDPRYVETIDDDSVENLAQARGDDVRTHAPARYAIGEEIARGGLGRVTAAHDRFLDREVAIKSLLERSVHQEVRFAREARLTARLQHPSIVPVYDIGKLGDGRPFYAMKLVSGRSLEQAIDGSTGLEQRLALLPAFINVVEAIAYAHHEGVIHRDLKPQNVVLGRFGEAMVIDWGIARELDGRASNGDGAGVGDEAKTLEVELDARLTIDGAVMGTPAYMAPEQAAGGAIDERADIYAFGAMLYHLLGGRPPYRASSANAVVFAVLDRPPAALAGLEPGLAQELIAIVDKAMAREPASRYPSAAELAGDLRRFATGQLVEAHRYTAWQRVRRFARRQTAALVVATAASLLLVAGGALALTRVIDARDRAERERELADQARDVAVVQRGAAEELTAFMLGELGSRLAPVGRLDLLGGVGRRVRDYYDALAQIDDDEAARRSGALLLIGDTQLAAGELDAAAQTFADVELDAREHDDARALVRAELGHATVLRREQRRDEAERLMDHAIDVCERIDDIDLLWAAVSARAGVAIDALDYEVAWPWAEYAVALAEQRVEASDAIEPHIDLAYSYGRIANLWAFTGAATRATPIYRAAIDELERARGISRADTRVLEALLEQYLRVARVDPGGSPEQRIDVSEARALGDELVAREPTNAGWQRTLRSVLDLEGHIAGFDHDGARMLASMRRAHAIAVRVVELEPGNVESQRDAATLRSRIGDALRQQGDEVGAIEVYRVALVELERATVQSPGQVADELVNTHTDLCIALAELERMPEAEQEIALAIEIGEREFAKAAANVDLMRRLGTAHFIAAELAESAGRTPQVREHATRILAVLAGERSDSEYVDEMRERARMWLQ